jgi:hypothetical protein
MIKTNTLEEIMREDLVLVNTRTGKEKSLSELVKFGDKRNELYNSRNYALFPQNNGVSVEIDSSQDLYKVIKENSQAFIDSGITVKTFESTEIPYFALEKLNGVNPFFINERDEITVKSRAGKIYSELGNFMEVHTFSSYLNKILNENKFYSESSINGTSDFGYKLELDFDLDKLAESYKGGEIRGEFNEYLSDYSDPKCKKKGNDIEKIIIESDLDLSNELSKRGISNMDDKVSYLTLYNFSRDFENEKIEGIVPISKMLMETFLYHASEGVYDRGGWGHNRNIGNFEQYLDNHIQSRVLCGKKVSYDTPKPVRPNLQIN